MITGKHIHEYRGIAYFKDRKDAEAHMKKFAPKGRVREYDRGYAIQTKIAGPYLNKSGKVEEEKEEVKESYELDEASVTVDLENDDPKLLKDIRRMGLKIKDNGSSGNDGYNEYTITGPDAKLKAGGKKFGWDQQVESYELGTDEYRDHALETTPGQSLTWGSANAYKQAAMKEALAKVWGLDEKVLDKSEEDDKIAPVKGKKSMTGGKVADIDVDPEMKDEK